jgi:putative tricarboxylic transport membrane protein
MDRTTLGLFVAAAGSLGVMIGLIHFIGVYFAVPLFLIFYMRYMGRHSWSLTDSLAAIIPMVAFFFFEMTLHITLPKGAQVIEETVFFSLYEMFLQKTRRAVPVDVNCSLEPSSLRRGDKQVMH